MAYPDFLFDRRVVQRNIEKGLVDRKAYAKYLAGLTDVEGNAEICLPEPPPGAEVEEAEGAEAEGVEEAEETE